MSKTTKQLPHERRKGEAALSEFAEFVEKQQALRYPVSKSANAGVTTDEHHEELDIIDSLNLEDSEPQVPLRDLLLSEDKGNLGKLVHVVDERLQEGHGEATFDVGFENNNESMRLTKPEWDRALTRLKEAAKELRADCDILLTKNIGGSKEAESILAGKDKDKDCSGKVLIRQNPSTAENVIETRIAVVGNGKSTYGPGDLAAKRIANGDQLMPEKAPCLASWLKVTLMMGEEKLESIFFVINTRLKLAVPAQ